jgi:uncharacterized membrane protein
MKTRLSLAFGFTLLTCIVFAVYLLWLQIRRYEQLGAYAFDLGIFQQAVWLMAHGETPFVTVRGMNILGDHFTPILYLIAIPYRIWAHPFWLFLAQTFALAAGALPLYRMALRHTQKDWLAAVIAIGYLLHPALFTMLLFDFHPVLLSIPFVLWAMDAADEGRPKGFCSCSDFRFGLQGRGFPCHSHAQRLRSRRSQAKMGVVGSCRKPLLDCRRLEVDALLCGS